MNFATSITLRTNSRKPCRKWRRQPRRKSCAQDSRNTSNKPGGTSSAWNRFSTSWAGKKCKGMEGLVEEGAEMIKEDELEGEALDAGLISAAQRVEHYEIAAYGCVRTYANLLGEDDAVRLLEQPLKEERETDQKLTKLAEK